MKKETKDILDVRKNLIEDSISTLASGKWVYLGYAKDLNKVLATRPIVSALHDLPRSKDMPGCLILSNKRTGVDLKQRVYHRGSSLFLNQFAGKEMHCNFFFLNDGEYLVAYPDVYGIIGDKNRLKKGGIVYHFYNRNIPHSKNKIYYTDADIETIIKKDEKEDEFSKHLPMNEKFYGHYELYDEILESDVKNYNGKVMSKTHPTVFFGTPLFKTLDFEKSGGYYLQPNLKFIYKGKEKETVIERKDTKMKLFMHNTNKNKFGAYCPRKKVNYSFELKTIGGKQYLFANLNDDRDANEKIYVYVKNGEVPAPKKATTTAKKAPAKPTTKAASAKSTKTPTKPAKTTSKTTKTTTKRRNTINS